MPRAHKCAEYVPDTSSAAGVATAAAPQLARNSGRDSAMRPSVAMPVQVATSARTPWYAKASECTSRSAPFQLNCTVQTGPARH